jgi:hypothetical protein|tara:strand:+ start:2411 stop:2647 length:237 start_codon:yes stop_codon:yes gene_type:complete
MARDIDRPMLWQDAVDFFENEMMPSIRETECEQSGPFDVSEDNPLRCETWNNWTDSLCKDKRISDWQYMNWSHPPSCD